MKPIGAEKQRQKHRRKGRAIRKTNRKRGKYVSQIS
jgi:hypothetical protein